MDPQQQWRGIAGLRLALRPHIRSHRHRYRGQAWTVLQDTLAPACYRFDATAMAFIDELDGERSVADILGRGGKTSPPLALTQDDIVALVAQLHAAELVQGGPALGAGDIAARRARKPRGGWLQRLINPTAMRFPLLDPDTLLRRWSAPLRGLFRRRTVVAWAALVALAVVLAIANWSELAHHAVTRGVAPYNLLLLLVLYPLVKGLHELAHGIATRHWGGEVHEAGVMLLVFVPVPYVDASASAVFPDKWRRIAVSAAGILAETTLAALAMLLWLAVQPGLVQDIAFNVMVIGGVATVLFNGNPLLRFDGYYVLADLVEIPNLATRANRYLRYLARRHLLRLDPGSSPVVAPGEARWFVGWGVAAFSYRIYITLVIALFVAQRFFIVGTLLALWVIFNQILLPLGKLLRYLLYDEELAAQRAPTLAATAGVLALVLGAGLLLPVPAWTNAEGVVSMPEDAQVRLAGGAFIDRVLVADGAQVSEGQPLFETSNPQLPVRLAVSRARLQELQALKTSQLMSDRSSSGIVDEQIRAVQAEIDHLVRDEQLLTVRSPGSGRFRVAHGPDLQQRYLHEGELLGYIARDGDSRVRVVVPQTAIEWVRGRTRYVEARYPGDPGVAVTGRILGEVPAIGRQLPSPALGSAGGGRIAVDGRDPDGMTALENIYFVDVQLPAATGGRYIGSVVHMRFDHNPEPLLRQWWRSLRQLFLARLDA
ncbi:MAG: efflux RND transporter periplasmic adaptor subunit [Halioglobus sp.]|nr:efflux RND transporter periplasmic adaptor subunit [Halioglobus sp.]